MDFSSHYCSTRRDLEEQGWNLSSRLFLLSSRLLALVGKNHQQFLHARSACRRTRDDLADSHLQLRNHRLQHGC